MTGTRGEKLERRRFSLPISRVYEGLVRSVLLFVDVFLIDDYNPEDFFFSRGTNSHRKPSSPVLRRVDPDVLGIQFDPSLSVVRTLRLQRLVGLVANL